MRVPEQGNHKRRQAAPGENSKLNWLAHLGLDIGFVRQVIQSTGEAAAYVIVLRERRGVSHSMAAVLAG